MKLSSFIMLAFLVTLVFFTWVTVIGDMEENYIDKNISDTEKVDSNWTNTHDRSEDIETEFQGIRDSLNDLSKDEGWFDQIADGSMVVVTAVIKLPGAAFSVVGYMIDDMTALSKKIGIPSELIGAATIAIFLFVIFKLVSIMRRVPV